MKRTTFMALSLSISIAFIAVANDVIEKGKISQKFMTPPPNGSFGTIPDEKKPDLTGTVVLTDAESGKNLSGQKLSATGTDKSVIVAKKNASAVISKTTIDKKGGKTSSDGQSNFYGLNAAVVAEDGATLSLKDVTITSSADGANAVFSTGGGTLITAKNITIHTTDNSSRGLDATYGGQIIAEKVDILTEGAHCAAFATDRGEGKVSVDGGKAETRGEGSPVIYSTGDITVKNLTGKSTGSQIACIEGKNSITLDKVTLSGGIKKSGSKEVSSGIMLYQSMSGDANQGTAVLSCMNSTLTSHANGPFFYVTNTKAQVNICKTKLENTASTVLIQSSGNTSERNWGKSGANGGELTFTSLNQTLNGNVIVDSISSIALNFGSGTKFTGAINASNSGTVNLKLTSKASLNLTADSYVNELDVDVSDFKNIKTNGHTLFYNKDASANSYLKGRTYLLSDGGKVCGIDKIVISKIEKEIVTMGLPGENGGPQGGMPPFMGGSESEGGAKVNASDMMGKKIEMPKLSTYTGKIAESSGSLILQTSDTKALILSVMEAPAAPRKQNGGAMNMPNGNGRPPAPPSGMNGGNGSFAPPAGAAPTGAGAPPSGGHNAPKPVTLDDLKKLKGKTVEIQGIIANDGKLTVFTAEEK